MNLSGDILVFILDFDISSVLYEPEPPCNAGHCGVIWILAKVGGIGYIIFGAGRSRSDRKRESGATPGGGWTGTCGRRSVSRGELFNDGRVDSGRGISIGSIKSVMSEGIVSVSLLGDYGAYTRRN